MVPIEKVERRIAVAKDVADELVELLSRPYLAGVRPKLAIGLKLLIKDIIDATT